MNSPKKTLYMVFKTFMVFSVVVLLILLLATASSYATRWTNDSLIENIPEYCYVGVDSEVQFVTFKTINNSSKGDMVISTSDSLSKSVGFDDWNLITSEQIKNVHYFGYEYETWFKYRVHNQQVEPISCRKYTSANIGISVIFLILIAFIYGAIKLLKKFICLKK